MSLSPTRLVCCLSYVHTNSLTILYSNLCCVFFTYQNVGKEVPSSVSPGRVVTMVSGGGVSGVGLISGETAPFLRVFR